MRIIEKIETPHRPIYLELNDIEALSICKFIRDMQDNGVYTDDLHVEDLLGWLEEELVERGVE